MANNVTDIRSKATDSEKITINLGYVDLGHVDLLVQEGFYSNRTDFIRTAIRNQIERHSDVVRQAVTRKASISASAPSPARILKRRRKRGRCSTSVSSGWQPSPPT